MFPLPRNKVEYIETDIGIVLDHFTLPPFQRAKNELHVQEIYRYLKQYYETFSDIMCTGSISFAKYQSEWMLLDGQHRVRALQQLATEVPHIRSIPIRTDIYHIDTIEQMESIYRIINETKKVDVFRTSISLHVWPRIEEWFQQRFPSYWKDTKSPVLLNVSREQVKTRLEAEGWLDKPARDVMIALEQLLSFYRAQSISTWLEWGYTLDAKRLALLQKDGFYFGIFRHYEWVARLRTPHGNHTSIEVQRKSIPHHLRLSVWNKRFDGQMNGTCYCCERLISYQHGFHCGHIVSVHDGGTNVLSNLEVVCEPCNLEMSTMNMEVYKNMK